MKELGRIRRLFYRDGVSLSEISRKTGYSRNTIKRWLKRNRPAVTVFPPGCR